MLKNKKVIIIGDKDGVSAPAIEACIRTTEGLIVAATTQCFSCSISLDLKLQEEMKKLKEQYGKDNLIVILGGANWESTSTITEVILHGDPFEPEEEALNIPVYHIFEEEIRDLCDKIAFEEACGIMEMVLEVDKIVDKMQELRAS
jgi:hypothetical protein